MIRFSSRAKKISWISIFSLMLVIIIGLSVGLAVVSSKDEEDWDVVTKDYAYKAEIVDDLEETPYTFLFEIKIANFTDRVQEFSFSLKAWDKANPSNNLVFPVVSIVYPYETDIHTMANLKLYDENGVEIIDEKSTNLNTFSISNFTMNDYYNSFIK